MIDDYIECLLWSSYHEEDKLEGEHSPEFTKQCEDDWSAFSQRADAILERYEIDVNCEQVGHDFALTRNRHGAGFWDREEMYGEECSKLLTLLALRFGEITPYTGDDGLIYIYN